MDNHASALRTLAAAAGVRSGYRDVDGRWRRIPAATRRALLAAMGFAVATREQTQACLELLENRPWQRSLPPVLVVRGNETPLCLLTIDEPQRHLALQWTVKTEQGGHRRGEYRGTELKTAGRRYLAGRDRCQLELPLPNDLPCGYHRLEVRGDALESPAATRLIVAPDKACPPTDVRAGHGLWGLAVQLYSLRSARNWGIGDFADLRALAEEAGRRGASAIALNPLHTLFPGDPAHISPYGPSSRQFLNTAYIAPPDETSFNPGDLSALRAAPLVDYEQVLPLKLAALEKAFHRHDHRNPAFRVFVERGGAPLRRLATFQALAEAFGRGIPWRDWPEPFRHPESGAVADFTRRNHDRVEFFLYLQWLADQQLKDAADICEAAGMSIGLCRDLAVGTDRWGAETWSDQGAFATDASVGAPPDAFNFLGQDWGIPPVNPRGLREQAYEPFIRLLRANMRHAGALRVDHILGWMRTWWVPAGATPDRGGYVAYPFEEMLAIAVLESRRNRCAIIGEDLGTVPRGLRSRLQRAGILSSRVLYFEREGDGDFTAPDRYPRLAAASTTTHDLPTLPGFIVGRDLQWRASLNLYADPRQVRRALRERVRDRRLLVRALQGEHLLPEGALNGAWLRQHRVEFVIAAYRYLARSRAGLILVYPEDILGMQEQTNLPGTVDQHPNWRRKWPVTIDAFLADPSTLSLVAELNAERRRNR